MRYFAALLLFVSSAVSAFDPELMEGQWAAHLKPGEDPERYLFLNVNGDLSGVLVRNVGGKSVTRTFAKEDVTVRTAYIEVSLAENETAILWAWRQNNGLRRVNGLLFEPAATGPVRNMLPVPLEYLNGEHPLREDPHLTTLLEQYPYRPGPKSNDIVPQTGIKYQRD